MKQFYRFFEKRKKGIKTAFAALAFLSAGMSTASAQVSAYTFTQTNGTYTPITGGTVLAAATGNTSATSLNSDVYPLTLPFNFNFNGTNYGALNVSTNGYVTFGTTLPSITTTTPISSGTGFDGAISAFGRDLNSVFDIAGVTGDITWTTEGNAPNREVVIQWKDFRPANSTSTTNAYTFSFQIRLAETSNRIVVVYNSGSNIIGSVSSSTTVQVGLRGFTNSDFNNRTNLTTTDFSASTPGTANNSTQRYSTVDAVPGMPAAGLTYIWNPPTCYWPTALNSTGSTINSLDVQWTAPTDAPASGYEIYYDTSSTEPTASTIPSITGITSTTTTIPNLSSGTPYYIWVRSACGTTNKSVWSTGIMAKTVCGPITSMFENFDSYATGNIVPDCWARIVGASNSSQTITATTPASGTRNIYQIASSAANTSIVVLPEFSNINAGTHWLRFRARVITAPGALEVGYVTSTTDASTFVTIQTLTINNTTYTQDSEYTVAIPTTVPAGARLAIRNSGISTAGHYWDDVYWEARPSCIAPVNININNISSTSATVEWSAPIVAPTGGYDVYYSTSDVAPTSTTTPSVAGVMALSTPIGPLSPATKYYVWVRSKCSATDMSDWSAVATAKTLCGPMTDMFENFDSYATGNAVPDCWARIIGASNTSQTINSTSPASGTRNLYQIASSVANTTIVVFPEFSNINAGTHWLRLKARVVTAPGSLDVGYVTNTTDASTFVTLQTLNILNTSYTAQDSEYTVIVPTTLPAGARLAIRNNGTSTAAHYWDDVYWEAKPSCIVPSNIIVNNVAATSATVEWSASVTPPAAGYDVYYSTSNIAPTSTTAPSVSGVMSLSTPIGPLTPVTQYFVWVRSRCSTTDLSAWSSQIVSFKTTCQPPAILSTTEDTVCPNQAATLSATTETGATVKWYDAATGGNLLSTGNSYTTPNLTSTTPYYVSASSPTTEGVGLADAISDSGYTLEAGLIFDALSTTTIKGVYVYPMGSGAGTVTIALQQINGTSATTIQSITVNLTGTSAPHIKTYVPLDFTVAAGTNYKLMMLSKTGLVTGLIRESGSGWGAYPLTLPGKILITNGNCCSGNTTSSSYYYFYDWQIESACESARQTVTATVDSNNCLSTAEIAGKDNIKVYPNPFSDIINISKAELIKTIKVSDASGKLVKTINKPDSVLRLGDLSQGMYILQLEMKDGSRQAVKVIKK